MRKESIEIINFGPTFKGIISTFGMLCFITGLAVTAIFNWIIGLIIIIPSLIIFISLKGVIIDYESKKVKNFFNIIIAKIGIWQDFSSFSNIQLRKINESMGMNFMSISSRVDTKCFDIYLYNKENSKDLLLRSYRNIKEATAGLKEYSQKFNIEMDSKVIDISHKKKN